MTKPKKHKKLGVQYFCLWRSRYLAHPVETDDDSVRYNSRYKLIWSLHICKVSNQKTSTLDFSWDQNLKMILETGSGNDIVFQSKFKDHYRVRQVQLNYIWRNMIKIWRLFLSQVNNFVKNWQLVLRSIILAYVSCFFVLSLSL